MTKDEQFWKTDRQGPGVGRSSWIMKLPSSLLVDAECPHGKYNACIVERQHHSFFSGEQLQPIWLLKNATTGTCMPRGKERSPGKLGEVAAPSNARRLCFRRMKE